MNQTAGKNTRRTATAGFDPEKGGQARQLAAAALNRAGAGLAGCRRRTVGRTIRVWCQERQPVPSPGRHRADLLSGRCSDPPSWPDQLRARTAASSIQGMSAGYARYLASARRSTGRLYKAMITLDMPVRLFVLGTQTIGYLLLGGRRRRRPHLPAAFRRRRVCFSTGCPSSGIRDFPNPLDEAGDFMVSEYSFSVSRGNSAFATASRAALQISSSDASARLFVIPVIGWVVGLQPLKNEGRGGGSWWATFAKPASISHNTVAA